MVALAARMFAGLHNCSAGTCTLFESARRQAHLALDVIQYARPLTPRSVVVDLAPSVLDQHVRDGLLNPERFGGLQKIELNMQALVERGNGPISIEPVWLDELFRVGDRHVTLWYERDHTDANFDVSKIVNVLLDIAKELPDDESHDQWIYGYLDFVHDWDAYYFKNDATTDELTIMLKRPVDEFAAFRLKRGRLVFETEQNDG